MISHVDKENPGLRVVFLGSPIEVIPILADLLKPHSSIQCVGVVSQPAKPVGRKQILEDPPVAQYAKEKGVPLLQPNSARDAEFQRQLAAWKPDVCITAAYGQILDEAFLKIPTRGTINVHPSRLPQFRGATPVPSAILAGLSQTAVSILFTVKKLDAGNLIVQKDFAIHANETNGELTARLFRESCPLLREALEKLGDKSFTGTPQDEAQVTHCKKIAKSDGQIDWTKSASEIYNRFRAFEPWPGSFTFLGSDRVVITQMELVESRGAPGSFEFDRQRKCLVVCCGNSAVAIGKLKPAGSKEMAAGSFYNGLGQGTREKRFS